VKHHIEVLCDAFDGCLRLCEKIGINNLDSCLLYVVCSLITIDILQDLRIIMRLVKSYWGPNLRGGDFFGILKI